MPESTNSFVTLRQAIENLDQLVNQHSTDFPRMSELVSIIKERYLELSTSQHQLIESNAALVKACEELGGASGCCITNK
jgi:hypothetical protein